MQLRCGSCSYVAVAAHGRAREFRRFGSERCIGSSRRGICFTVNVTRTMHIYVQFYPLCVVWLTSHYIWSFARFGRLQATIADLLDCTRWVSTFSAEPGSCRVHPLLLQAENQDYFLALSYHKNNNNDNNNNTNKNSNKNKETILILILIRVGVVLVSGLQK